MGAAVHTILYPIIWTMEIVLSAYVWLVSSTGVAVLMLSFTFCLLMLPVRRAAERFEQRIARKMNAATQDANALKKTLKGEELFWATEKIYAKHRYHPIQSIGLGASFFVMLPFLLAALLLLSGSPLVEGQSFLWIDDLSKPDRVWGPVNLLPIIMLAITLVDAQIRFSDDAASRRRFYIIAMILFLIVYNLPSAPVLYWIGANLFSVAAWLVLTGRRAGIHSV